MGCGAGYTVFGVPVVVYGSGFYFFCLFFFKLKTAYEMRISDWSSDVCSSDLRPGQSLAVAFSQEDRSRALVVQRYATMHQAAQIGRASCRERVCQYV